MAVSDPSPPSLEGMRQALRKLQADDDTEGLRERKKRQMRQHISDTATRMFLERGFDEVRVTDVAVACGVSEKTVYNYFPNKESLVFDREEEMAEEIALVLGPAGPEGTLVEVVTSIITRRLRQLLAYAEAAGMQDMSMIIDFTTMLENTPSLRTAQREMSERFAQAAASAMAERVGVNPEDPEPQIAADTLVGLWRVYFRSTITHARAGVPLERFEEVVLDDVRRAARLIDSGLWSFSTLAGGPRTREQLRAATAAAAETRQQVFAALEQARASWKSLMSHYASDLASTGRIDRDAAKKLADAHAEVLRQMGQEIRASADEVRAAANDLRSVTRRARGPRPARPPRH